MKIEVRTPSSKQINNLVLSIMPNNRVNAISLSRILLNKYGLHIDWHDMSSILEGLFLSGYLNHAGHNSDGMTEYIITI